MFDENQFVLRWGIIGAGRISATFVKDLVLLPEDKGVADISHAVVAVGSRIIDKARDFIQQNCPEGASAQKAGLVSTKPVPYGSYAEAFSDPNVDIIYIGTPHSCHFEDAKNALEAGKHVLLEKPACLNQAEFKVLSELSESKKLFLMEAVWTRFFPLTFALEDVLFKEKAIGDIRRLQSDFSVNFIDIVDEDHRMLNINLAGGGLLDLGPYPLVWALLLLYNHPQNGRTPPASKAGVRASLSTSIGVNSPRDVCTRVQGTTGEIILPWATARPEKFTIRRFKMGQGAQDFVEEVREFPIQGMGLHWEADAVARDIRDGKIENERMPHADTLIELAIFDEVRRQGGYIFPKGLEKVEPPN